jgi:Rps23 Pro-64 3,4-dihydroxylase Tpa1-like proline 4-hydroxylase
MVDNQLHADDFCMEPMLDYQRLQEILDHSREKYQQAEPFPHIVIDNFITPEAVDMLLEDFPMPQDRINHDDASQKLVDGTVAQYRKHWLSMEIRVGLSIRRLYWELNSADFIAFLQELTGIQDVVPDPYRAGGGLHESREGGFLMIHADYNRQPETDLDRRMNCIIYLNKDWQPEWGGNLELWTPDMKQMVKEVEPVAGRAVIFNTGTYTYHGHPRPLACPPDRARKSISTFYYTNGRPEGKDFAPHMTIWKKTPEQESHSG